MKRTFKLTCFMGVKAYVWRVKSRDFHGAITLFNTASQFDGYELLSIEMED